MHVLYVFVLLYTDEKLKDVKLMSLQKRTVLMGERGLACEVLW